MTEPPLIARAYEPTGCWFLRGLDAMKLLRENLEQRKIERAAAESDEWLEQIDRLVNTEQE